MKLENQVISLEQAKRLHELGVTSPALFEWVASYHKGPFIQMEDETTRRVHTCYPAYTVAELGEMLPTPISIKGVDFVITSMKSAQVETGKRYAWTCRVENRKNGLFKKEFGATEAQARAAMLIYLLENNLLTP